MGVATLLYLLVVDSKEFYSSNITAHAVSSVYRSDAMMVEIFCQSQKWDFQGVVAGLVSKVNFEGLYPKIVSTLLNSSRRMKTIHARKTQTVI